MRISRIVTGLTRSPTEEKIRNLFVLLDIARMGDVKAIVDSKIQGKKVMMFSKSFCPYCTKAKQVFDRLLKDNTLSTEDYEVMEIEDNPKCDAIQSYLQQLTGGKSVPRVFINQKFIGGGDDVAAAHKSGQLVKLL